MAGSDYFKRMFNSDAKERDLSVIEMKETTHEAFRILLRFIYTKDASDMLTADNVLGVYVESGKHLLSSLQDKCLWYVQSSSNLEATERWNMECEGNGDALSKVGEMLKGKLIKNFALISKRHPELIVELGKCSLLPGIVNEYWALH